MYLRILFKTNASAQGLGASYSTQANEVGNDASWRSADQRMTHFDLLAYVIANGAWNPIWLIPHINARIFRIDWLHCCDMGCAADWIGNLLWLLQTKYPGGNVKERVRQLWMDIDAAYKRDDDRLQNLIDKMIKQEAAMLRGTVSNDGSHRDPPCRAEA